MAKLNSDHKLFIVQELACFRTPTQVAEAVKAEFDIDIDRAQVQFYDPTKRPFNKKLPEKWKTIFEETRKQYVEGVATIPIAHKVYRLEVIQRVLNRLEEAKLKNNTAILQTVEQGAKESGGLYTNRRELTGKGGEPLVPPDIAATILKVYGNGDTGGGDPGK